MIKAIAKLIVALNGNVKKSQIAAGLAWGVILGLIPMFNFYWIVLFVITFLFKHNHWSKIFSMLIIKLLSPLYIFCLDGFGWQILHIEALRSFFTILYNMPFVPFTKFNNTLVMGGLAGGALLWLPSYFIFLALVTLYRNHVAVKIRNFKIVKAIGKVPLITKITKLISKSL